MNLTGKYPTFRKNSGGLHPYRILILLGLMVIGMFVLRGIETEQIQSPFLPTPIPTRTANSFAMEAETQFFAGDLNKSITAYQQAVLLEPTNVNLMADLARMQVYSSELLTTDAEKKGRLDEALATIEQAIQVDPDNSTAHAVRAFALSWSANPNLAGDQRATYLTQAEQEAIQALQLDNQNTLALAYYAEILISQQNWVQAEQYSRQAIERDSSIMDVHRVRAYVLESLGNYGEAIREYQKAIEITPNLTPLYLSVGVNYRQLQQYEIALEYFASAAAINERLGVKDPIPYTAIGKTYVQMGEFFIAGRNVRKALNYNPTNPDVYASLGITYFRSRNYEGSLEAFKCAIQGCDAQESCNVRKGSECSEQEANDPPIVIEGLPLSGSTVVYYYTYGSALAGLHRETNGYCAEAMEVLGKVRNQYANEPVVMQIVQTSENICASFGYSRR
jgi:tetratricopeptide (TPR) repeat protein